MNDRCRLIASLSAKGPVPVPLHPCCMTALVALHDRDRPDAVWLCPLEEQDREHSQKLNPAGAP